ncbi:MAG TPA: hypothetical protein VGH74_14760 [Planctomycetaceae bacterium]
MVATGFWVAIVAGGNYCWSAFAFEMCAGGVGFGNLVLGVFPSGILYLKKRERRDRTSLVLAGCSFLVVLFEAISLEMIPMRGE